MNGKKLTLKQMRPTKLDKKTTEKKSRNMIRSNQLQLTGSGFIKELISVL